MEPDSIPLKGGSSLDKPFFINTGISGTHVTNDPEQIRSNQRVNIQEPEEHTRSDTFEKQNGTKEDTFHISEEEQEEQQEYTRSLLSEEELANLEKDGNWSINEVRDFIKQNVVKESMEARGEIYALDPEVLMLIDLKTNFNVFIAGDNIYTREELVDIYPFKELNTTPENVFIQQEIGVFPPKKYAINSKQWEYIARDVGDKELFIMLEDMVGQAARFNYKLQRAPKKIVKTKIFFGKEAWEDFSLLRRLLRGVTRCLALEGGDSANILKALPYLFSNQLLLRDSKGVSKEKLEQEELENRRREKELRRREKELLLREQQLREKQEEIRSLEDRIGLRAEKTRRVSVRKQNRNRNSNVSVLGPEYNEISTNGEPKDSVTLPFGQPPTDTESEDDLEGIIGELLSSNADN